MEKYANLSGSSSVVGHEIGDDYIEVYFRGNWAYLYTIGSVGASHLATMKSLANAGRGLSSFISRNVGKSYESKRRY